MTTFRVLAFGALFGGAGLIFSLSGCGGARPETPAASPAPAAPAAYPQQPGYPGGAAPTQAAPPPVMESTPAPAAAAPSPPRDQDNSMAAEISRDLRKQEQDIAAGNCPTACRALASMERAVSFLCASTSNPDDADRCSDAKRRLGAARRRVRATCGACPGGPNLEQDAPLPSR